MSDKKPIFNKDQFCDPEIDRQLRTPQQTLDEGGILNNVPSNSGLLQGDVPEPTPVFVAPPSGKVLQYKNAYIVFGRDRPHALASGFGGIGAQKANTIDLVVGRMASVNEGEGPCHGTHVHNSFVSDAARIYISQLTKVDENFGLADHMSITDKPASAVAIKADGVRIIGRQGIKIVTGGHAGAGETNSLGARLDAAPRIELNAGNYQEPEALQPVLLGTNTLKALKELDSIIDTLWSAIFWGNIVQINMLSAMTASPFGPAPIFGGGGVGGVVSATAAVNINLLTNYVTNPMGQIRNTKMAWSRNYLEPYTGNYICSKNVRTT